ncbi:MAG: hypothetical protein BWX88_04284 [Planctomycetes bacterium ADurb.Bin126]|nr:MAG: hypothetical protein BWX88_04284 [Planctomycetes bacterium ADurb.Bin126]HOD80225.1 sialate O-acetylesterase [Phycisphaerae bacterium]HQL72226.1 sialate O-acetylesterase [Phycisphaerae bacterium]
MKAVRFVSLVVVATALAAANAVAGPLKVYIMTGQSNMQGKARPETLPAMAKDPQTKALYDRMVDADGKPRVYKDVQVAALSSSRGQETTRNGPLTVGFGGSAGEEETAFGPELAFGVTLYEHLKEPILIIKASWGGKDLHTDFRPPSAGPYYPDPSKVQDRKGNKGIIPAAKLIADKAEKQHKYYQKVMQHVKTVLADPGKYHPAYDKAAGYEIAGFVWFQGWNDMIGPYPEVEKGVKDYSEYSRLLALFIRDVRKDLGAPKMPFVIGVLGVGGVTDGPFQNAQAAPADMPEFKGNVAAVRTGEYWDRTLGELDRRMAEKVVKPVGREARKLDKDAARQLKEKLIKENFTAEELKRLETERSNAGFHYLGSAKIYSRIGEAFAQALLKLKKTD